MSSSSSKKRAVASTEPKEPPKKKRATEAERLEKDARSFVEREGTGSEGKLKKTLTDYIRDKAPESAAKKKGPTAAERLEMEARRFVEMPGVPRTEGEIKRTLTDFVWDKKSLRQEIRLKTKEAEKEKSDAEEQEQEEQKVPADKLEKSAKKGTKRKAKDKEADQDMPDWKVQEYSRFAGRQQIPGAAKDSWGNAKGNEYDLIRDHTMKGRIVLLLNIIKIDFSKPEAALKQKGFNVTELREIPTAKELRSHLSTASQLWVISSHTKQLNDAHIAEIKEFFEKGRGVYIWGDKQPFYVDANQITQEIFGISMSGNVRGDKNVQLSKKHGTAGFRKHLCTTGVETLYEGITIATIDTGKHLEPLVWGSADNIVIAFYDKEGKRAMVDGGFTRLYYKWDAAGTARFVKNCAGWLTNIEAAL